MDECDAFIEKLQSQIFDEAKEAFGEAGFQRWQNPFNRGRMESPDVHARIKGKCGDTMEIFLKFENNHVKEASFVTDGCGSSTVCGSFAAEMVVGRDPDEILEITGQTILNRLGTFPEEEEHCAFLAAETLQEAVNIYMTGQKTGNI